MAAFASTGGLTVLESKREFAKELWNGFIPIEFSLAQSDLSATELPDPCYSSVSRFSYISAAAEDVVTYFRSSAVDLSSNVWFEYEGVPLRANVPIGCLFDMYCDADDVSVLPWRVVIHFQFFPVNKIIMCGSLFDAQRYYYHGLKQCLFILYGNLRSFSQLTEETQNQLWKSIVLGERLEYDQEIKVVVEGLEQLRKVPLRAFVSVGSVDKVTISKEIGIEIGVGSDVASSTNTTVVQREYQLIQVSVPKKSKGKFTTAAATAATAIASATDLCTEDMEGKSCSDQYTVMEVLQKFILPACTAIPVLTRSGDPSANPSMDEILRTARVTCHGIELEPTFTILDVWELFRYADLCVYWTVHLQA